MKGDAPAPPGALRRLATLATVLALIAAITVAYTVFELSRYAASDEVFIGPLVLFSGTCFLLAWPFVFIVGWLAMRRGGSRGAT